MPQLEGLPARGLQSIFDKHPGNVPTREVAFLDEETLQGFVRILPLGATLSQLREQLKKDCEFPAETLCEQQFKVYYVEGGMDQIEAEAAATHHVDGHATRGKKHKHQHVLELKDDKKWTGANAHWAKGTAKRRDASLVKFTKEVCEIIDAGHPGPSTFAAANRLCNIIAVPRNVTSLRRLHKMFLVHKAVTDLLDFRDPYDNGRDLGGERRVGDNSECLSVACGAHLHWHLAGVSEHYARERCDGDHTNSDLNEDGVPEPYEKFQRLLAMGLSDKVRGARSGVAALLTFTDRTPPSPPCVLCFCWLLPE